MQYYNQDYFTYAISQFSQNLITENFMPKFIKPKEKNNKKKFKRYDHIKCVVCGDISSGFHYGAYTCEACKLFFIRSERQKREFNECKTNNCFVSIDKRKSCATCRYKACIANGMDLTRRKFGRHTNETQAVNSQYVPNISQTLTQAYQELSNALQILLSNYNATSFKLLFEKFYEKCQIIIGINQSTTSTPLLDLQQSTSSQFLDMILLIVFFNMFDLSNISYETIVYQKFAQDLNEILKHMKEELGDNELTLVLKIICFVYIMHIIEIIRNDRLLVNLKEDACKKRLIDLIKSEFTMFKFKKQQQDESKNNESTCYLNMFLLSIVEIEILIKQYIS